MYNFSLASLHIISFFTLSPLYTINQNKYVQFTSITNSYFNYLYSNIIYTNTQFHSTIISGNTFSHILNTPIVFTNSDLYWEGICDKNAQCCIGKDYNFKKDSIIRDLNITEDNFPDDFTNHRPYFYDDCGNITITQCTFYFCYSHFDFGGGILIEQDCTTIIHECIFDTCHSGLHGCAGAIAKRLMLEEDVPIHDMTRKLDIQYTCCQRCSSAKRYGFGSAFIIGAYEVSLFYTSAFQCINEDEIAWGAQEDILCIKVNVLYNNITLGYSMYCTSIEIRKADICNFKFQTITKTLGKIVLSFSPRSHSDIYFGYSNIFENAIRRALNEDELDYPPSIIFYQLSNISVESFYFSKNELNEFGLVAFGRKYIITFINCVADFDDTHNWMLENAYAENCSLESNVNTLSLYNLNLGDCMGMIKPGPMIITSFFTQSHYFSKSDIFTISSQFTQTNNFDGTNDIASSEPSKFTGSDSFLPTLSKQGQIISNIISYSISYVKRRSVSFSTSFSLSYYLTMIFNRELGEYSSVMTQTDIYQKFPYIIQIYSPTIIPTEFLIEIKIVKKIKPEQLIGLVCGSVAVVFSIIGITILFIRKRNSIYVFSDDLSSSSSSSNAPDNSNEKIQETVCNIVNPNIPNVDVDNWL